MVTAIISINNLRHRQRKSHVFQLLVNSLKIIVDDGEAEAIALAYEKGDRIIALPHKSCDFFSYDIQALTSTKKLEYHFTIHYDIYLHNRKYRMSKGFTLIELLISLTIVAMITAIVFGGLRVGIRAWEKGEQNVEKNQRERASLDLMKRQLASLYIPKKPKGAVKTEQPFFLKGDRNRIAFLSSIAMIPGNDFGTVYAVYEVRPDKIGKKLVFYEKTMPLLKEKSAVSDDEFYDLIPQADKIEFEYLKEGADCLLSWDSETDKGALLAVRITFKDAAESTPIIVIARIEQQPEE